ncbi:glycosyltransferase [Paenibacillus bouchesdurhonensis]|uniref:glycosyltransferase n=1 Tax=Paenibacillus bouchesdurhonensis TaxID=1870990 RepID=UPI001F1CDF8D|nr:glycosyltransferase [Paenibacillus bouchesdurhonensis]
MNKCSVLLPVYNGEAFIRQALDSVLTQDYPNFEVVIVDDCSSDSSRDIILEYKQKYTNKIKFIQNEKNGGVGLALLKAFKETESTYIAQIGQDDIWGKDYLSSQIHYIETNGCNVVFSKVTYIGDNGDKLKDVAMFRHDNMDMLNSRDFFSELIGGNFLCAPSSVFKIDEEIEDIVTQFWGYNNDRLQDFELWLNLACYYKFGFNKKANCNYRIHQNNFSKEEKRITQGKYEFYATLKRVLFSEGFVQFLKNQKDKKAFLESIIIRIQVNIAYSKLLFVLLVEWCEYLLNLGFDIDLIRYVMADYYNRMGLLSKCISNYGKLYHKINAFVLKPFNNPSLQYLVNSGTFEFHSDLNSIDVNTICLIDSSLLDYAMNNSKLMHHLAARKVMIFCKKEEQNALQMRFPELLIISDEEETNVERKIITYIEDKTNMFSTGFFFDHETLNSSITSQMYRKIKITPSKDEQIRRVQFISSSNINCTFSTITDTNIDILSAENNEYLLDSVSKGDIYLKVEDGLELGQKIIVNNKLYILFNIEFHEEIIPVYKEISYYSLNIYSDIVPNHQNPFLELEYHAIVNSRSYRYMMKLKKFVHKYKLLRFVNFIDMGLRKITR